MHVKDGVPQLEIDYNSMSDMLMIEGIRYSGNIFREAARADGSGMFRVERQDTTLIAEPMQVFVCTDHDNVQSTGVASVVVASDIHEARKRLDDALVKAGLKPYKEKPYTMTKIEANTAHVLVDGDY